MAGNSNSWGKFKRIEISMLKMHELSFPCSLKHYTHRATFENKHPTDERIKIKMLFDLQREGNLILFHSTEGPIGHYVKGNIPLIEI